MRILEPVVYDLYHSKIGWTCCLPSPPRRRHSFFSISPLTPRAEGDNWESNLEIRVQEYDFLSAEWAADRSRVCV